MDLVSLGGKRLDFEKVNSCFDLDRLSGELQIWAQFETVIDIMIAIKLMKLILIFSLSIHNCYFYLLLTSYSNLPLVS